MESGLKLKKKNYKFKLNHGFLQVVVSADWDKAARENRHLPLSQIHLVENWARNEQQVEKKGAGRNQRRCKRMVKIIINYFILWNYKNYFNRIEHKFGKMEYATREEEEENPQCWVKLHYFLRAQFSNIVFMAWILKALLNKYKDTAVNKKKVNATNVPEIKKNLRNSASLLACYNSELSGLKDCVLASSFHDDQFK